MTEVKPKSINGIHRVLGWPLIAVIYLYRYTFSPIFGNCCRFEPTCSHYAEDAIRIYGPLRGIFMAIRRIGRCHPWADGGFDPVR